VNERARIGTAMAEIVRCPDCGGIVGATEATDDGPPCKCFNQEYRSADTSDAGGDSGGTDVMPAAGAVKVCRVCGKDLTGKKRLKDRLGYWCPECAEEDKKRNVEHGTACAQCGRKVPEKSMTSVDGKLMCSRCFREQRQLREPGNKKFRAISDNAYKEHEKRNMIVMAVVLAILLVLMYIAWIHRPWEHSRGNDLPGGNAVAWNGADARLVS
jgi:DNA-directed RNA polymerase subunit RPC12/RpoP